LSLLAAALLVLPLLLLLLLLLLLVDCCSKYFSLFCWYCHFTVANTVLIADAVALTIMSC